MYLELIMLGTEITPEIAGRINDESVANLELLI